MEGLSHRGLVDRVNIVVVSDHGMLNRYRADLGVVATSSELEATAKATVRQLQADTATLSIARSELAGTMLNVDVDVRNLTGHKFPTGYPARRT